MPCLTDANLVSWIGFECVVTDCFACNDGTWTGTCAYTSTGTPACNDTAGVFNNCAYVQLANECAFDILQFCAMTIGAWVKTCRATTQALVTKTSGVCGGNCGWHLKVCSLASGRVESHLARVAPAQAGVHVLDQQVLFHRRIGGAAGGFQLRAKTRLSSNTSEVVTITNPAMDQMAPNLPRLPCSECSRRNTA